ncbi:hypothetical protein CXU06_12305 [Akkermansia muciniphila]|nr:hypothetical protein CXU08_03160 [Akkermansia muciniphila]PNC51937.1 hypothetical protein CXU06_12305 [Akkermansia muciniphila]PNC75130.1 hypothetical protein CXU02_04965 [Akkermansia muciniphila]QAA65582.1 hypothetical protein C1O61_00535 [Akkermansia muciniphila]QHV29261.1 hypothetical protein C5O16_00710 [Akkermansia muciniphila]
MKYFRIHGKVARDCGNQILISFKSFFYSSNSFEQDSPPSIPFSTSMRLIDRYFWGNPMLINHSPSPD